MTASGAARRFGGSAGIACLIAATPPPARPRPTPAPEAAASALVDAYLSAQARFDQRALDALILPGFVEVSPLGEVDAREEVLGFYAPDKKRAAPPITVSERLVRPLGPDAALVVARLSFAVPDAVGGTRTVAMRGVYHARRDARGWRLAAAQYTPITPGRR